MTPPEVAELVSPIDIADDVLAALETTESFVGAPLIIDQKYFMVCESSGCRSHEENMPVPHVYSGHRNYVLPGLSIELHTFKCTTCWSSYSGEPSEVNEKLC